jgi:DNA mismatch repair protein MutL
MEDGLVVMDPHAAHERVIYDRWMGELEQGRPVSQPLLIPETVELSDHDAERVSRNLAALDAMGFGISEFGPRSFIVDAVPSVLGVVSVARILPEIAASLEESGPQVGSERWVRESIASAACRAAVKARDILKLEEVEQLVVDLAKTRMPYTCPHGRPTLLHFSFSDLRRKFGRTG